MPSTWEKWKAARAQQKTPEGQDKLRKQTDFFMDETEGLLGFGPKNVAGKVAGKVSGKVAGLLKTKKLT